MQVVLDTNVLLRVTFASDPYHGQALAAVKSRLSSGDVLVLCPQVIYELWTVATRPKETNGYGLTCELARLEHETILDRFTVLPEVHDTFAA